MMVEVTIKPTFAAPPTRINIQINSFAKWTHMRLLT